MNTYANAWPEFTAKYSASKINDYVERGLQRMYMGSAPSLSAICQQYGKERYNGLVASMIDEIFKFSGLKEHFPAEVMDTVSHTMRTQYPWLKITELMHFVYLFRLGQYDKFYGKPNGATLMQMLRQYIRTDRERLRGEFLEAQQKEQSAQARLAFRESCGEGIDPTLLQEQIDQAFAEDAVMQVGAWRYRPWGTAMARAYFADGILATFPGDLTEAEQEAWAQANAPYVAKYPNLNPL